MGAPVFDPDSGMWVVDPRLVTLRQDLMELLPAAFPRLYDLLPLRHDEGQRLMVGMLDPANQTVIDEVTAATGCEVLPIRLDLGGGSVPSWKDIDWGGYTAIRWKPAGSPLNQTSLWKLVELPERFDELDRLLDASDLKELWVMGRAASGLVLARRDGQWQEALVPSTSFMPAIVAYLKELAGIERSARGTLDGEFKRRGRPVKAAFYPGEHGEEVFLTFSD